jgi:hypothetical protein
MRHIVIHDDSSSVTHYVEFDDLHAAASYLENLVNQDEGSNARLFALEPVEFAVKSYVKVEIGGAEPASAPEAVEAPAERAVQAPAAPAVDVFTQQEHDDTVEYVEAAMAPVDVISPAAMPERVDDIDRGEPRRGLFGR